MSTRHTKFAEQLLKVRPVTRDLVTSILMDSWPGHAAVVHFGIDSQKHYEALYHPIREEIHLVYGRVHVRRDPNPLELLGYHSGGHDVVLRLKPTRQLA